MLRFGLALSILVLGVSTALAAPPKDPCQGATTRDMEACAAKRVADAKAQLAKYLAESKRLIGDDKADLNALNRSQQLWTQFVEADCQAAYRHFAGGSIRSVQYSECELGHTQERTRWLWVRYLAGTTTKLREPPSDC